MNKFLAGFLVGAGAGLGVLFCPQVRHFMDKMENKIMKKKKKLEEKAEE